MREEVRSHQRLARLARRQHGIVSSQQLLRLGYSKSAVGRAVAAGRLHRVHRGVYAVGRDDLSAHGRCLAAVAACGTGALLSHASAAWLWGLFPQCGDPIHVSVPRHGRKRSSIRVNHSPALRGEEREVRERIPVTALPRTLLDLAAATSARRLERTIERVERDRVRQEELKLAGIEMIRLTARRIAREPEVVMERLAALLARRRRELR